MQTASYRNRAAKALARFANVDESRRLQSVIITGARVAAAMFAMVVPIVLVRVLDQTTFGHYKLLFLISQTALGLLTIGLPASLYYFIPRAGENSQRYMVQTYLLLAVLGSVAGLMLWPAGGWIERFFDAPLGPWIGWIAVFTALSIPGSMAQVAPMVDRRSRLTAVMVTGIDVLRGAMIVVAALVTRNLTWVLIAACITVLFHNGSLVSYLIWRGRGQAWRPRRDLLVTQLAYAVPFAASAALALARNQIHAYWVATRYSAAEFAVYAVATLNIPIIGYLTQTVGEVTIMANARNWADGQIAEMQRVWHRATYVLALVLLPLYGILSVYARELIGVVFGEQYIAATPIFRVFLLILPLSIPLASAMLRATGDMRTMVVGDLIALGVNVLALVLAATLGPMGAVVSIVSAKLTFVTFASRRAARRLDLGFSRFLPWGFLFKMLAIALGGAAATRWALLGLSAPLRLVLGGSAAAAIYAIVAWRGGLVPTPEREAILALWRKVRGKSKGQSS